MKLTGKVAIVTGAGSGIGKALATRLAQDGASIVIPDVRQFDVAAAEIAKATGVKTLGLQVDVSSESDVARMAAETMKAFGRIDILVNNAAVFSTLKLKPFEEIPVEEWRKVMEVNTLGVFYLYGFGVERNKDEARKWFERANASGYAGAAAALRDL